MLQFCVKWLSGISQDTDPHFCWHSLKKPSKCKNCSLYLLKSYFMQ